MTRSSAPDNSPVPEDGPATVLVVDPDGVSRRFVEGALSKAGNFAVETVEDAAGAIDILRNQLVDLIITETDLRDMNGVQLVRRLAQESRLRNIPVVFLSADSRVTTKVLALRAGADDFLVKPCDQAELVARVDAQIGRQRRVRDAWRRRAYNLAGDFSAIAFPDLVVILEMGRRTGTLAVGTRRAVGEVFFNEGRVVHAVYGNLVGSEAFFKLMAEGQGQFEFLPGPCEVTVDSFTIEESVTGLIMEGARLLDTERHSQQLTGAPVRTTHRPPCPSLGGDAELVSPLTPTRLVAAQFELGVGDGFTLGELRLFTYEELAKWTRVEGGRDRLHVLFLADLAAGVSAMLSIAAPPTEKWVLGSLSEKSKAFGLSFFLRHERLVDIVLVDVRNPNAFRAHLHRVPSFVLIAPPDGDFLAVGTKARVDLEGWLRHFIPPSTLWVGNAALEGNVSELSAIQDGGSAVRVVQGELGVGHAELRNLLVDGIKLWGRGASGAKT